MPLPEGIKPFTVSAFTQAVKARLEEFFPMIWISGEVSTLSRPASGHLYFKLKDASSQLSCVMFRGSALRQRFDLKNGDQIFVRGELTVYSQRGEYQLTVHECQLQGEGDAERALKELRRKLLEKGYFAPERKRPIPRFPRRIALVTSSTGAAIRDMLELLRQRWPLTQVVVHPCRVQGDEAPGEIVANLKLLSQLHLKRTLPLCAIVLGRGGGSAADLSAFNEEIVADAIFHSAVPIISAVGHEIDITIADLVADRRAETPTAAIVSLVPHRQEIAGELNDLQSRLREAVGSRLKLAQQRLTQLAQRSAFRKPLERIRTFEQRLDETADRLNRAAKGNLDRSKQVLESAMEQLEALSPLGVLKRGYSLTRRGDGRLVRTASEVAPGEVLTTRVNDGEVISKVLSIGPIIEKSLISTSPLVGEVGERSEPGGG